MGNKEQIKAMQEDIYELYEFIEQLRKITVSLHESDTEHIAIFTTIKETLEHINDKIECLNIINDFQAIINEKFEERIKALEEKVKE